MTHNAVDTGLVRARRVEAKVARDVQRRSTTPRRGSHPVPPSYTTYRDDPATQSAADDYPPEPPPTIGGLNGHAPSAGRPLALRNWRVRTRLVALILVPTIAAVVLAGLRVASSLTNAESFARTHQLTDIDQRAIDLILALQDERDEVVRFIVNGRPDPGVVQQRQDTVDGLAASYDEEVDVFNETFESDEINAQLGRIADGLDALENLRAAVTTTALPADSAFARYTDVIDELLNLNGEIGQDSPDREVSQRVQALDALARTEEFAARIRGLIFGAITVGEFVPGDLQELSLEEAQRLSALADFFRNASLEQRALYDELLGGFESDDVAAAKARFIALGEAGQPLGSAVEADVWASTAKAELDLLRAVAREFIGDLNTRTQALQDEAQRGALLDTLVVALVLFLAFLGISLMGRSMTRPLRRLQTSAFEVAETRLPEIVRGLEESEPGATSVEIEPIGVASRDEIGDVARAFDAVHAQAVRLAVEQAELRSNVNAMFVNLSRRSQGLVERQLRLIEDLENSEQDPDQLGNLFRLDHLATRMRRNGENLLVLAGEEPERRWSQPVPFVDVIRAAISEVEQYERIELTPLPDIEVAGRAVNDVVHLLAELLENATVFSSGDTRVLVTGHVLGSGGIMLEVEDQGIGLEHAELDAINERLTNPPVIDVSVSRRMGLFVVGRLAHRHGIRVRLRAGQPGGITALVAIPPDLVSFTSGALPVGAFSGQQGTRPTPPDGYGPGRGTGLPQRVRGELVAPAQNGLGVPELGPDGWPGRPLPGPLVPPPPEGVPGPASPAPGGGGPPQPVRPQAPWSGPIPQVPGSGALPRVPGPGTEPIPQAPDSGSIPQGPPTGPIEHVPNTGAVPYAPAPPPPGQPPAQLPPVPAPPSWPTTAGSGLPAVPRPLPQPLTAAERARAAAGAPPAGDVLDPAAAAARADRDAEPIFASIQSEWFRKRSARAAPTPLGGLQVTAAVPAGDSGRTARIRQAPTTQPQGVPQQPVPMREQFAQEAPAPVPVAEETWASPSDQGWRAAAAVAAPSVGGYTTTGLPRRVPKTNLVPGSADAMPGSLSGQGRHAQRSADEVRGRLSSLHRGTRRGREESQHDADDTAESQPDGQENA